MMINNLDKFLKTIMSPKVFSYTLIWLIILVLFCTIAQKNIGLYASQMKYFSSFYFLFLGFIPLPGGRLVLLESSPGQSASYTSLRVFNR